MFNLLCLKYNVFILTSTAPQVDIGMYSSVDSLAKNIFNR